MDQPEGQLLGLAPIAPADLPTFRNAFSRLSQPISDYSFANTFVWGASLKLYWRRLDRHLCVFANGSGDLTLLLPPIPEPDPTGRMPSDADLRDALSACFEVMDGYNALHATTEHSRVEYVSDEMLERTSSALTPGGPGRLSLSATPMGGDYIYDTARMIDLAGGPLKSKRHARSKFLREHPDAAVAPLVPADAPECLALLDDWRAHGDAAHDGELSADLGVGTDILRHKEAHACRAALGAFDRLGLDGLALRAGGRLVGFTLGETLSPSQASVLIEKTDPACPGAAQFIFSAFCRLRWAHLPEVNAGDDWGIPSLRFTKTSYRPVRMLSKYTLTRQPRVVAAGFAAVDGPASRRHAEPAPQPTGASPGAVPLPAARPTIGPAVAADLDGIVELERLCYRDAEDRFTRRQLRRLMHNPRALVSVARQGGRVVAASIGLIRQHRAGPSGRLYALAVHPQARGGRLGESLVRRLEAQLARRGIARIYLEVRAGNTPARRLYDRLGYQRVAELPNYYGRRRHGLRMRKMFRPTE